MVELERKTKETDISISLNSKGTGQHRISTGVGFFDHMLEALSKHSLIDLEVQASGDLHIDAHHTVEDVGIVIGKAFAQEVFPIENVERFASSTVILDEAAVEVDIDLSGRPFITYELDVDGKVGDFDCELVEEFFRAFAFNARISVHIIQKRGKNRHHIIEAAFKSFAVALRRALTINERMHGAPSTKGIL
jgi:imidazoleglycerol-phosphate dehydratase